MVHLDFKEIAYPFQRENKRNNYKQKEQSS